eukprot:TRINITY_DN2490_c0_g2_i3.p1 TRINITY_DN2490_c0_g2~~TRINITY_DN2490_c0_g2_i3.p1  ORF type:complete len:170 (+),score=35.85 TRINITY_DN2490_c0_g2_i3:56-565(+)
MNEFNHSQNSALQKKIMRWAIGPTLQLLQAQSRDQESLIEADPKITEANGKDNSDSILIPQFLQPKFETLTQRRNYKLGLRSSHKKYAKDKQDIPPSQDLSIRRQKWSPFDDPKATKKPHKTIFVSNLVCYSTDYAQITGFFFGVYGHHTSLNPFIFSIICEHPMKNII